MNHEYTLRPVQGPRESKPAKRRATCVETTCPRCDGHGWFRQFKHVDGGRCFRCNGTGRAIRKVAR